MKKFFPIALLLLACISKSNAQTPTWADDVATIIYNNCSNCHREGGIGPFTLMSYEDAVNNAFSIQAQTESKLMPPWKADPDYTHFKDERYLSETDINTISTWVAAGAPSGDLATAPPPPVFQTGSQLPVVDLGLQTPSYTVPANEDQYRTFVVHSNFTQDVFLNQIEYLPGNGSIVHHVVIFYDPTNWSWNYDQDDPLPGYESYGVGPINNDSYIIGAWAPGSGIFSLPSNMGILIPAGSDFGIEMHYAPGSEGLSDITTVNLKFTPAQPVIREVHVDAILNHFDYLDDGPLFIPANTIRTFHESFFWEYGDISLISIFPHMHRIGKSFKVWSLDENADTTRLINIPNWSFHWQGFYNYQKPVHITDPSILQAEATYDNTVNNPDNPSNPPQDVEAGEHTTDEMMLAFFTWLPYEPGDENIILDSSLITTALVLDPVNEEVIAYPNPVHDQLNVYIGVQESQKARLDLYNPSGSLVKQWHQTVSFNHPLTSQSLSGMPAGIYLLKVTLNDDVRFVKIMKD
ncbi:MAG: T9SS type A sorting domain-containing protein [Chitinophagales bacterium]